MKTSKYIKGVLAIAAIVVPISTFALTVDTNSTTGVNVDVGASSNTATETQVNNVNTTTNTNSSTQLRSNVVLDLSTPIRFSRDDMERPNTSSSASTNGGAVVDVSVDSNRGSSTTPGSRADVNVNVETPSGISISIWDTNNTNISSRSEMEAFVRATLKTDANIRSIEMTENEVSLSYKEKGRFLGLFPIEVYSETKVDAEGNVKVKYPWYRVFTSLENKADIQAELDARIKAMIDSELNAEATTEAGAELSARERARIVNEIKSYLKARAEASANVNASTNTEVDVSRN